MAAVPSLEKAIVGIKTRATIDFLRESPKKLPINGKWGLLTIFWRTKW
jgi:hypothetical protein